MSEAATKQRQEALRLANRVRQVRAEVKAGLRQTPSRREAMLKAAEIIEMPADELETMRIEALLRSIFRMGTAKANRLLIRAGIPPSRTIGGITGRQRAELVRLLKEDA